MKKTKILVMDVDGTLTDGKVYMGKDGEIMKAFNIKDGYGIHDILPQLSITPVIITGRTSQITQRRCDELGIKYVYQGIHNKIEKLNEFIELLSTLDNTIYSLSNVAYCGDDCNDLDCMNRIKAAGGVVGCPCNAVDELVQISDFVSTNIGGEGAVREFIEWIKNNL